MAQSESLVDQGVDRVQDALKTFDKEFQKVQRQVKTRRRTLERRLESRRKSFQKQAQKIEKQAQKQIKAVRKNDLVKRVETLSSDVQSQIESGVTSVLSFLQIASKSDIERVDRKLNRINRKLKDLEASPQG